MKSEFGDRKTIGTQIVETQEKHEKSDPIEVGDLVREFGKKYMSDLFDYIEEGSKKFDKFYINILSRKTKQFNRRAIEIFPYIQPVLPRMQPNQEVWRVDCVKQKYDLEWSLPDVTEFDMVLANPSKDNKKLIEWIKIYKNFQKKSQKK